MAATDGLPRPAAGLPDLFGRHDARALAKTPPGDSVAGGLQSTAPAAPSMVRGTEDTRDAAAPDDAPDTPNLSPTHRAGPTGQAPAQRPPGSGGAARRKTRAPRRGLGIDVTPTSTPSGSPELSGAPARDISPTSAARPPPPLPAWDLLPSPAGREGGAAAATWAEPPTHEGAPMVEALVMVREVYVNRKLAQKWADGLPWARCDWSGTELDQESRERYDAMWPDLIAEARSLLGADLSELMAACDAEWAKVKGERIAAFERAQRGARPGTEALRAPRGILKKSNRRAKERKARRVGFVESPEVSS